ncbi:MAG: DUF1992 domain-containing protein [Marinibacterium sp.]|nr:DUF1992 domain-containing protein [Marinibacterium sp.]
MTDRFQSLAERQILKARAEGQLDNLEGQGAPLPHRPEEAMVDAATAAGHRMMARAGAVPPELVLRKELQAARAAYASLTDPAEKKAAMARIADLELRHNIAMDARKAFLR